MIDQDQDKDSFRELENKQDMILRVLLEQKYRNEETNFLIDERLSNLEYAKDDRSVFEMSKSNRAMMKDLNKLLNTQIGMQDINSISWDDLPKWFSIKWRKCLVQTITSTSVLPLKCPIALLKFGYDSMVLVANWWLNKVKFVAGHILWFIVMSLLLYLYYSEDTDSFWYYIYPVVNIIFVKPIQMTWYIMLNCIPSSEYCVEVICKLIDENLKPWVAGWFKYIQNQIGSCIILVLKSTICEVTSGWIMCT